MRKLKLQMQISINGFVSSEKEDVRFNWDEQVNNFSIANLKNVDCILLGSNTAKGFIPFWGKVAEDMNDPYNEFARKVTDIPKVVVSHTLTESKLPNTKVISGELHKIIDNLKKHKGKDIIVYGGAGFVSLLIHEDLIDEYDLLINPVIILNGLTIFESLKKDLTLMLLETMQFSCGTLLARYAKATKKIKVLKGGEKNHDTIKSLPTF